MSDLDNKEQDHVRATLNYLRIQMGGISQLARALRFDVRTVRGAMIGSRDVCASMALRVARLIDASIDDLLSGRYEPGACPKCGHKPKYTPVYASDFKDESTIVEDAPRQTRCGPIAGQVRRRHSKAPRRPHCRLKYLRIYGILGVPSHQRRLGQMGALDRMWENRPGNNGNYNDPDYREPPETPEPPVAPPPDPTTGANNNQSNDGSKT